MERVDFFVIDRRHDAKTIAEYMTFGLHSRKLPLSNILFTREDSEYIYVFYISNATD
jgi:hypothetical protein